MAYKLWESIKNSWNVFKYGEYRTPTDSGASYSPLINKMNLGRKPSVYTMVLNRVAIDAAAIKINHVRVDDNDRTVAILDTSLNDLLNIEANIDQTGRDFCQDVYSSTLSEGYIAVVPIETDGNPEEGSYKVLSARVGRILDWRPRQIYVDLLDDRTGVHKQIWVPKETTVIVVNPFFDVMNAPNSTLQRLLQKMSLLDLVDKENNYGGLDLIIQLPYSVRQERQKKEAKARAKDLERQLSDNRYGVAYIDATEKVVQLNRSLGNNLLQEISDLRTELFNELGWSNDLFNGNATEEQKIDYYNNTIEPLISAFVDEIKRKWLTKTAITQKQSIKFYRDPFRVTTTNNIAEIADKFTRNAILSSNELRSIVGFKPSDDPKANELVNNNLNQTEGQSNPNVSENGTALKEPSNMDKSMDQPVDINHILSSMDGSELEALLSKIQQRS